MADDLDDAELEHYRAAGLFDPDVDAGTGRLELLRWLTEHGFPIEEMVASLESRGLGAMAGDRRILPGELLDRDEVIAMGGLDAQYFDDDVRAFGIAPLERSPDGVIQMTADEAGGLARFAHLGAMFTSDESAAFVRVVGSSLGRIADAAVSLFLTDIESRSLDAGESELELAMKVYEAAGLLDGLAAGLDPLLRRHVLQAIERSRLTTISTTERLQFRYAVGFVDLVGFTEIAGAMESRELAAFLRDFEARAYDVVTRRGSRVVKLIGDEVMFVASDAAAACETAAALMDGVGVELHDIVPRGGLAYGDVLVRGGDYYGSVVNLASRLVDEAVPEELLVTAALADAASPACTFEPAGRRKVKGFADPVTVRSLVR